MRGTVHPRRMATLVPRARDVLLTDLKIPVASHDELAEFKKLAEAYSRMTVAAADVALGNRDLLEICHDA